MKFNFFILIILISSIFSCKKRESENPNDLEGINNKTIIEIKSKDSIKNNDNIISSNDKNLLENKKLLSDFYSKNIKKNQVFIIDNNKDTTITCYEKTRINIKAKSFIISKTSEEINNKIKLSVREYYKISDIILAKLSTISNGKLLETGGMLEIAVTSNQEKCELKNGKTIEIEFPRTIEKIGMQLYGGILQNNQINWELFKNSIELNQTFSFVDEMPTFPGGISKMNQLIIKNINLPEEFISGKVYTSFIVDKDGSVTNVKIVKGLQKEIDLEVINSIKKLPKFISGKKNGVPVNVIYNLPITIQSDIAMSEIENSNYKKTFEKKYNDETLKKAGANDINYYLFSSSKLGMINCDRLWKESTSSKVDFAINFENNSQTSVNIIFHRFKSIMNRYSENNNVSFENIPSGEKITIFAIKYFEGKPFLAIKETEITNEIENKLVFNSVTIEKLKFEMEKLNQIN
jgi:Gram-negative bacterial TonB protein C-terminal